MVRAANSSGRLSGRWKICWMLVGLCSVLPWRTMADLPVHATINDLKGSWLFRLTPSVSGAISTCGSGTPNRNTENLQPIIADPGAYLESLGGVEKSIQLQLSDDSVPYEEIRSTSGNKHRANWRGLAVKDSANTVLGGWSTVYDEGFEVHLRDKMRLMAIVKYTKNDSCPAAKDGDLEDRNGRTTCYQTDPTKTQLGWYTVRGDDGSIKSGCFYAEKQGTSEAVSPASFAYVRHWESNAGTSGDPRLSYYLSKEFVEKHNQSLTRSWEASLNPAFIEQHHASLSPLIKDFGFSKVNSIDGSEAIPSFLQGENVAGNGLSSQQYACPCKAGEAVQDTRDDDDTSTVVLAPTSMLQSSTSAMNIKEHLQGGATDSSRGAKSAPQHGALPKAFAWSNPFTDVSFSEHADSQGSCGSCYAIASVYALQKRFEIAAAKILGRDVSIFSGVETEGGESFLQKFANRLSPQSVLSCSFYNQGCNGGFPYLVGRHAAEVGILEEGCMPYAADDAMSCPSLLKNDTGPRSSSFLTTENQSQTCDSGERRWFAKDYGYVGGCYECGSCSSEESIMSEIYNNGPVTAAFDAPASLFSYKTGVYDTEDAPHARLCDNPGAGGQPNGLNGWEYTNHAVSIVGWGETKASEMGPAQKYWIIRNTWGPAWGNKGYFLLARGKNAGGIESQVTFIDPDFSRGAARQFLERQSAAV